MLLIAGRLYTACNRQLYMNVWQVEVIELLHNKIFGIIKKESISYHFTREGGYLSLFVFRHLSLKRSAWGAGRPTGTASFPWFPRSGIKHHTTTDEYHRSASRQVGVLGANTPVNLEENSVTVTQSVFSLRPEQKSCFLLKKRIQMGLFMPGPLGPNPSGWGAGCHGHCFSISSPPPPPPSPILPSFQGSSSIILEYCPL